MTQYSSYDIMTRGTYLNYVYTALRTSNNGAAWLSTWTSKVAGRDYSVLGVPLYHTVTGAPTAKGDVCVDVSDSNKLKYHNGTTWVDLTSGGSGGISLNLYEDTTNRGTVSTGTARITYRDSFYVGAVSGNNWNVYIDELAHLFISPTTNNMTENNIGTSWNTITNSSRTVTRRSGITVQTVFVSYAIVGDHDSSGTEIYMKLRLGGVDLTKGYSWDGVASSTDNSFMSLSSFYNLIHSSASVDLQMKSTNSGDDAIEGEYVIGMF